MVRVTSYVVAAMVLALVVAANGSAQVIQLTGANTVPPVATTAAGSCAVVVEDTLDDSGGSRKLNIVCATSLTNATAAHIHRGERGANGPVVFPLELDDHGVLEGEFDLDDPAWADLWTGNFYVNVHTAANPAGEIRGQLEGLLRPRGAATVSLPLDQSQVVPATGSTATGRCSATVVGSDVEVICRHDVVDPTAAHIHVGEFGTSGGVVVGFPSATSPMMLSASVNDFPLGILSGNYYVNVHSSAFPAGEIRGQITGCVADSGSLCLADGRFRVTARWRTPDGAEGEAVAIPESSDTGMFWFFSPDNTELVVKVLNGCAITGSYWVFAAGLTDVEVELSVTDTASDEEVTYLNSLGMPFQPIQDTAALPTCP